MTCVVAAKRQDGSMMLCADCCVSWELKHHGSGEYIYRDELQKLYCPTPSVCIAIVGDLRPAQRLLKLLQARFDDGVLFERLLAGRGNGILLKRVVPGLIRHLWESRSFTGRVDLAIGVDDRRRNSGLFTWSSLNPLSHRTVGPGKVVILGTILKDAELTNTLRQEIERRDCFHVCGRLLTMPEYLSSVYDVLATSFAGDRARDQLVGGLFQIAKSDNGSFSMPEFEATQVTSNQGMVYRVSVTWDELQKEWVQRDLLSGRTVRLLGIDKADFQRAPDHDLRFSYSVRKA